MSYIPLKYKQYIFSDKIATEILHKADLGEGPRGARASPLFWVKEKKSQKEEKPAGQATKKPTPPPLSSRIRHCLPRDHCCRTRRPLELNAYSL